MGSAAHHLQTSKQLDGNFMMDRTRIIIILAMVGLFGAFPAEAADDSYRFLHVTISTPWYLFIFLLGGIFSPFILMAVLAWYSAVRKSNRKAEDPGSKSSVE
jgi:hypothetical protein